MIFDRKQQRLLLEGKEYTFEEEEEELKDIV